MTDADIIEAILKREGGFVDNPADKGGATRWGITLLTLSLYRGKPTSAEDVKALTEDEARTIYRQKYIVDPHLHMIENDQLRALLVDSAVNHGPSQAVRFLQHALWIQEDGVIGSMTLQALLGSNVRTTYSRVCTERMRFYGRLISHDHTQAVFASGWLNRVGEFMEDAPA